MPPDPDPADGLVRFAPSADGIVTADVMGDLDLLVTPGVTERLVSAAGPGVTTLVVDLGAVTLMTASAIAMCLDVVRLAGDRGTRVRYVAATRAVLRPLAVTGDDAVLPLYSSQAAALGA